MKVDKIFYTVLLLFVSIQIQTSLVPQTILRDWAEKTFVTNTDYWTFRKQVLTKDKDYSFTISKGCTITLRKLSKAHEANTSQI